MCHGRRELPAEELRRLFAATRASARTFRGLRGKDRFVVYLVAAATGFRANAVAKLTPVNFDLDSPSPTVTTAARFAKNRRTKVQPLPAEVAEVLRGYLAGRPAAMPVWPGTWRGTAAEMLWTDLDAVGIPYAVDGPDGPECADFHALRHSHLTLGGRSGIDLRTLQELAGHSTPTLTARYLHMRRDAAVVVDKMPTLVPTGPAAKEAERPLRRTGTGDAAGVVSGDIGSHQSEQMYNFGIVGGPSRLSPQSPKKQGASAFRHRPASFRTDSTEWAVPGLNRGPNDFQSPDSASNPPENKAIPRPHAPGRSTGRSDQQSEGGIPDAELAALVAAWPTLPEPIRRAMLALVQAAD